MSRLMSRVWLRARIRLKPPQKQFFHSNTPRYSVSDRIRTMLLPRVSPGEQMFVSEKTPPTFETKDFSSDTEAEALEKVRACLKRKDIKTACELALTSVPFHRMSPFFLDEIFPALKVSPASQDQDSIPLYNLVLVLQAMGHEVLASQLLLELGVDARKVFANLQLAEMLQDLPPTLEDLDDFLSETTGEHFPQILYRTHVPLWFRTIVLSRVSYGKKEYFQTTLQRYGRHFESYEAMNLLLRTNPSLYSTLCTYLLAPERESSVVPALCGFIDATSSPKQINNLWRRLRKHKLILDDRVAKDLLRKAVLLNASYTVPSIVKATCQVQSVSQLSKALLSVAWSQKLPENNDDEALTTAWDVQTEQVSRLVDSLDPKMIDPVIIHCVTSLTNNDDPIAGRVLWAVILGIDKSEMAKGRPLSRVVSYHLSRAMIQRPLLEQVRFMTLDCINTAGISTLLKSHVTETVRNRRKHGVSAVSLESDQNVKLMLAGMIIMTEKASPSLEKKEHVHMIRLVRELFENWDPEIAADLVENLNQRYKPSPEVAIATMGLLLKHGNTALAVQVMREIGPENLEPAQLNRLLVEVGRELPIVIVPLVSWLIRTRKAFVPPAVIRKLIVCLSKTEQMSYGQRFGRTIRLLNVLRGLGVGPGPEAAAAMVDAMIKAAAASGRGSRRRLQWALDICQREGVPEAKVKYWLSQVLEMRSSGRGYWQSK